MSQSSQDDLIKKRKLVFQEKPLPKMSKYNKWNVVRRAQKFSTQVEQVPQSEQVISMKQKSPDRIMRPIIAQLRGESKTPGLAPVLSAKPLSFLKSMFLVKKFFHKSPQVQPSQADPPLTRDEIVKKFKRARTILRSIFTLNQISEQIVVYGTSSNLFDLSSRDRPAIKRYLFPLLYQEGDDLEVESNSLQFPLIHPKGIIKFIWSPILVIVMIYTATLLPFRLGFVFNTDSYIEWIIFDNIMDGLFWIDLIVTGCTTFYDEQGKLVRLRRDVFLNYFKTWFFVDFLSCLPMEIISTTVFGYSSNIKLIKIAKVPRLFRVVQLAKIVKFVGYLNQRELINLIDLNSVVIKLITFAIAVSLQVHLMACLWNYLSIMEADNIQNWGHINGLDDASNTSRYIACVYFALTGLTTVGYGDIHAETTLEMIIVIFWMLIGVGFYSVTIGILSSVLKNMDQKSNTVQRKIAIMNEFCKEMKISKELNIKLKKVLEYNADKQCFTWIDYKLLFEDLPIALRHEIIFNIHNSVISDMQFFKISENRMFAISLVPYLKPRKLMENEYLWLKNTTADGIYLLVTGRVVFLEEFTFIKDGKPHTKLVGFKSMINGSFFGETELIYRRKREFYVQCEQTCEFYFLDRETFDQKVSKEFPTMYKRLKLISEERMRRNQKAIFDMGAIIEKLNLEQSQNFDCNQEQGMQSSEPLNNHKSKSPDIIMKELNQNYNQYQDQKTLETLQNDDISENQSLKSLNKKIQDQSQKIDQLAEKLSKINSLLEEIEGN